ncbi:MAG: hypothetical protein QOJ42_562 [Acidobacteriaceae bacterium]|jgi:hypothetical protein|nr:hypothetical protein [Acidobacteriaceae bacterium]
MAWWVTGASKVLDCWDRRGLVDAADFPFASADCVVSIPELSPVGRIVRGIEQKNLRLGGSILCRRPPLEQRTLGGPLALEDHL